MNGYNPDRLPELDAMRMGTSYRFPIKLRNFEIFVRPLAMSEVVQLHHRVAKMIQDMPPHMRSGQNEHYWAAREYLKAASTSDVGGADWSIADPVLDRMTVDEIMHLYRQYIQVCDRVNPSLEFMPKEKVEELLEQVKKNETEPLDYRLIGLSFSELVSIVRYFMTKDD